MAKGSKTTSNQRRMGTGYNGNGNPEKIKGQGFHTHPERINKAGRPRVLHELLKDVEEIHGVTDPKPSQIRAMFLRLLQLSDEAIKKIVNNPAYPRYWRRMASLIGTGDDRQFMVLSELILDRGMGRPQQVITDERLEPIMPTAPTESQASLLADFDDWMNKVQQEVQEQQAVVVSSEITKTPN